MRVDPRVESSSSTAAADVSTTPRPFLTYVSNTRAVTPLPIRYKIRSYPLALGTSFTLKPRFLEQTFAPGQYTMPAHQPGAPRLRLITFVVSVRGALGSEAQTFIRQISARVAGAVPYRLLDEART